ncbi:MAG: acyl-CoA reductase [Ferruginibacter sp.]|nr:acyl-CoA reductase [Ferruginibacter sp.]
MDLQQRLSLMVKLGEYMQSSETGWVDKKHLAEIKNSWFIQPFIDLASANISKEYLSLSKLNNWVNTYHLDNNINPVEVGVIMAGNLPMVGFHDLLSIFICGHKQRIKCSSKDDVLITHLVEQLYKWEPQVKQWISFSERLNNCDAYIATGSNQSARYFEMYFKQYPHIIRKSKTGVAVLNGNEQEEDLIHISDDMHTYFGRGCRNVTKIYVPEGYDFVPLLNASRKYSFFSDHNKYKNNYDYRLSLLMLNGLFYMTNGTLLLTEEDNLFSPIAVVNYSFYDNPEQLKQTLSNHSDIQCISGTGYLPPGMAQQPQLTDYADGVDTMQFLLSM